MKRFFNVVLLVVSGTVTLAGCHADITYKIDVHPNSTATVSLREVLDDQLYQMAMSQADASDPFNAAAARKNGWTVSQTIDEDGNHVFMESDTVDVNDLQNAVPTFGPEKSPAFNAGQLNPSAFTKVSGLFTDTGALNLTIPPLMPPSSDDASNPFASTGNAMVASIVGIHLELRTPGTVIASNGATTTDGYTRWDLSLQHPTTIQYTVQTPDVMHIAIAILVSLLVIGLIVVVLRRVPHASSSI